MGKARLFRREARFNGRLIWKTFLLLHDNLTRDMNGILPNIRKVMFSCCWGIVPHRSLHSWDWKPDKNEQINVIVYNRWIFSHHVQDLEWEYLTNNRFWPISLLLYNYGHKQRGNPSKGLLYEHLRCHYSEYISYNVITKGIFLTTEIYAPCAKKACQKKVYGPIPLLWVWKPPLVWLIVFHQIHPILCKTSKPFDDRGTKLSKISRRVIIQD